MRRPTCRWAAGPSIAATARRGIERPPLRLECSYAVTAWTREAEDEHRLLSQTLAVLLAYTGLPERVLSERLAEVSASQGPIMTRIGQPKSDHKAEFWTAVGGRYRVSLDYVVTLSIVPGVTVERGPEVRTHTVRVADLRAGVRAPFERHRSGGIVRSADGQPVADAWLVLPEVGAWASSGADGRFSFTGVPAGKSPMRVPGAGRRGRLCGARGARRRPRAQHRHSISSSPTGSLAVRSGIDGS